MDEIYKSLTIFMFSFGLILNSCGDTRRTDRIELLEKEVLELRESCTCPV
jgi:hypothetical protein